ncbi:MULTISPECIES: hypothetical protein [Streptomyces]|uniref:Ricin B lectin domain-containing protein n=2 Tax=Streptomyces rimosus subsp. rimosus TaxID=132474 RepID=L8EXH3_STRR1|nr:MULTISPECIES: hypothetical protein [Streptomyces]KOG75577.1 hypothetical protein ADK78_12045 [Kitasatospora aureofaciens]MYT48098.1 hypothetical protein [Streptomyces sp. SID5471]KOT46325.1 hypothetical protein ADK42_00470 [Streptomyces rimosus subsp. rimosus]KOT47542.1 hypothetical protein ADK84_00465 [Streptomyces sp. NRRL WC-3701]KOT61825.1 hypothetical protein ADK44_13845 [Streptomyces rimosus subsp. rimosus]
MRRYTAALACAAALTVLTAGSAAAVPADAPQARPASAAATIQQGHTYVLAPQDKPDQWLGDADYYGSVMCQASRLWYGNRHDDAVWLQTSNADGSITLVNTDAEQVGRTLQSQGEGVFIRDGNGDAAHWFKTVGPGGAVSLRNKLSGRYLTLSAAGTVVAAVNAYWWYMVNTIP